MQGVLTVSKNPLCKVGGRLDMTFADEIREMAETKTTYNLLRMVMRYEHLKC